MIVPLPLMRTHCSNTLPLRMLLHWAFACCVLLLSTHARSADRKDLIAFGALAPEIGGLILNGPQGTKLSDYRGKVVAVDFWATWCAPCLESMPEYERIRGEIAAMGWGDRFEIIGVNVDRDIPKARKFLQLNPVSYPIIGDPLGIAMQRFGPWKLPATFLLTPEGRVHMIWLGYGDTFAEHIKTLALELLEKTGSPEKPPE